MWPRVTTWLEAENIVKLIVLRAHLLPASSIANLLNAVAWPTGVTLFVHQAAIPAELGRALTEANVRDVDVMHLDDLAPAPRPADVPVAPAPLPVLRHDGFLFFLDACDHVLGYEDYGRVVRSVGAARRTTDRWLESLVREDRNAQRPSPAHVLAFLRALTHCTDSQEALARIRGAQVALFFEDLLIDVDPLSFVASHQICHATAPLDAHAVELLRAYSSPILAAAGTLALAGGAGSQALARLTFGDVASDGTKAQIDVRPVIIPDHAGALVRAQHIDRRRAGASSNDAFFQSRGAIGQAPATMGMLKMLAGISTQTGLPLPRHDESPRSWLDLPTQAISVHALI